jgi:hypothetical protein
MFHLYADITIASEGWKFCAYARHGGGMVEQRGIFIVLGIP